MRCDMFNDSDIPSDLYGCQKKNKKTFLGLEKQ